MRILTTSLNPVCLFASQIKLLLISSAIAKKRRITLSTSCTTIGTTSASQSQPTITSNEDANEVDQHKVDEEQRSTTSAYFSQKHYSILIFFTAKQTRASLGNPMDVDSEGLLVDVCVQPIQEDAPTREDKRRDIDHFFYPAVSKSIDGNTKKYCACKLCPYVFHTSLTMYANSNRSHRDKKNLVSEITTLRRHMEAHHSVSLLLILHLLF